MEKQILEELEKVRKASYKLSLVNEEEINKVLNDLAITIKQEKDFILLENKKDLDLMDINNPMYDRLKLTSERLDLISSDIINVSKLDFPIGITLEERTLSNGLNLKKVSVPMGVIGIIYESRPNVTLDVFSLCLKSGSACVLKGGKEADFSNKAIIKLIEKVLEQNKFDKNIVYLMSNDRTATQILLKADKFVDVIIPRGSQNLINFVRENSKIPVIETGAGIVHTYFDESGDLEKAKKIIFNAKTRRPSVCNSLDTLLVHCSRLDDLYSLLKDMDGKVEIFADELSYKSLVGKYSESLLHKAKEEDFGKEFLSLKMSVKIVDNIDQAIDHIMKYTSKHSEAIITEDDKKADYFIRSIDSAVVYVNTSTAFTDGGQFGMGAEIGISTQKLHARGPMALREITSYKWVVKGDGQVRY
jgi:glutamate-5-semialdehyde dehydrogenase